MLSWLAGDMAKVVVVVVEVGSLNRRLNGPSSGTLVSSSRLLSFSASKRP